MEFGFEFIFLTIARHTVLQCCLFTEEAGSTLTQVHCRHTRSVTQNFGELKLKGEHEFIFDKN